MKAEHHVLDQELDLQATIFMPLLFMPICLAINLYYLNDPTGPDPCVQDVLRVGHVGRVRQSLHVRQKVRGAIGELVLVRPPEGLLQAFVLPQVGDDRGQLGCDLHVLHQSVRVGGLLFQQLVKHVSVVLRLLRL